MVYECEGRSSSKEYTNIFKRLFGESECKLDWAQHHRVCEHAFISLRLIGHVVCIFGPRIDYTQPNTKTTLQSNTKHRAIQANSISAVLQEWTATTERF